MPETLAHDALDAIAVNGSLDLFFRDRQPESCGLVTISTCQHQEAVIDRTFGLLKYMPVIGGCQQALVSSKTLLLQRLINQRRDARDLLHDGH